MPGVARRIIGDAGAMKPTLTPSLREARIEEPGRDTHADRNAGRCV